MKPAILRGGNQAAALTVAGSDSGGNAGIQADIRAFHAFGVHACTAIAAVTAQNPAGVSGIETLPPQFVASQIEAVLSAYAIGAAKTGTLSSAAVVCAVADLFRGREEAFPVVVDPVMVATSGAKLLADDAASALAHRLLPAATLATPNLMEAEALAGLGRIASPGDMVAAARAISAAAGCAVLVKGGHLSGAAAQDLLWTPDRGAWWFESQFIRAPRSTHGTGCSLSAAIAAALALGGTLEDAVFDAKAYVYGAVRDSVGVGREAAVLGFSDPAANRAFVSRRPA